MSEFLEAALQYAGRGWRVHPLKPRQKTPLTKHGFKDATIDPGQIKAWWARWPAANVGIATGRISGLLVIDLDGSKALQAFHRIEALFGNGERLPPTLVSATGRGWHLLYSMAPEGPRIPCSRGEGPEEGIDVRADGGFICAPPSIHPTGTPYKWISL